MVRLLLDYEAGLDCWGCRTPFDVAYVAKRDDTLWVLIEYGIAERREALEELPTVDADSLPDWAFDKVQLNICHVPLIDCIENFFLRRIFLAPWFNS
jgi:hypothetical protein